jgi:hypothetical protein
MRPCLRPLCYAAATGCSHVCEFTRSDQQPPTIASQYALTTYILSQQATLCTGYRGDQARPGPAGKWQWCQRLPNAGVADTSGLTLAFG